SLSGSSSASIFFLDTRDASRVRISLYNIANIPSSIPLNDSISLFKHSFQPDSELHQIQHS
ncbi:MAG TPA: hypothetical protein PLK99_01810, partial [Burkholderiales bacterium]|nr:hypothetical protein [Burkholderiales bacterium]